MPEKNKDVVKGTKKLNSGTSQYNALQFMIQQALRGQINTAIPVKVTAVSGQYVSCIPLVTQVDGYGEAVSPAELYQLPFLRIQGGIAAIIADPVVGDIGLAVFAKADCSNVKQGTSEPQQPASFRKFSMSDGFYLGGFLNQTPQCYIEVKQDNTITINADTVNISGDCVIGGISFLNHVHTGDSGGTTSPPR